MNEQAFRRLISGETTGAGAALIRPCLRIAAAGYGFVVATRDQLFNLGWMSTERAAVPVISVGNLTTGGTGKTPVVALIIQLLQRQGFRPAIISRGYRSLDGQANDEKRVLERLCPSVPHVQNRRRIEAAREVCRGNAVDVIVVDDGFQHRQLYRDFDIVLIDATNPFGYDKLLPRGLLREPLSSLKRADIVLITRSDLVLETQLSVIKKTVAAAAPKLEGRIQQIEFRPTGLIDFFGKRSDVVELVNEPVLLVSGIGNPEVFAEMCRRQGLNIARIMAFPDHHHYTETDLRSIATAQTACGASRVVTTLKDLVKLSNRPGFLALEIRAEFPVKSDQGLFETMLQATMERS